jgi:CDP-L-myo-inositol myo-inositolphosphotransferase
LLTRTGDTIDLGDDWAATRTILRGTAKSSDGLVSRWLNRPVSQFISSLVLQLPGVRPWHASVGAAVTGLLMVAALLFGGRTGLIAGGVLFHAASVIDGVDGEIARATYRASRSGAILDTTIDMITNLAFFLCITVALTRLYGVAHLYVGAWLVGWAALGLLAMRDLAIRAGEPGNFNILKRYYTRQFPTGIPALIRKALIILTSRDTFAFVFAVDIVIGLASATFYSLAGFVTLWVILIAAAAPGLLREAQASAAPLSA